MKKVIFMGTPDFSVPILERLVNSGYEIVAAVTQPDRPKGRKRVPTPSPVKKAATRHGIQVFQPEKLAEELDPIMELEADIIVTAAYGQLLPEKLLHHPPFGCINVHASLLPELRGGAPIHHAIMEGKKETGITIMYMAKRLDAGDIIGQQRIAIDDSAHVGILHDKLSLVGADLLEATLPDIFNGVNQRLPQEESIATFASNISRDEEKIDWSADSQTVYNQIRGLHPWPVAYTLYEGERMKIWWGEVDNRTFPEAKPGEIVCREDDTTATIACGDHHGIKLTSIQPSGKKRMQMTDFLRGNPDAFKPGQWMG